MPATLRELVARNSYVGPGTDPVMEDDHGAAEWVDDFLRRSAKLTRLDAALAAPGGGLDDCRQLWTGSATIARPSPPGPPRADMIEPVRRVAFPAGGGRPCGGLWTSTALRGTVSPWSVWREVGPESSALVGEPISWRLVPSSGLSVLQITGAADWIRLISRYPCPTTRGVAPEWVAIAARYDAVHVTRWAFTAVELVD